MIGEGSGIVQDRGLNILYRVTMNTLMNLVDTGLTATNTCYNPSAADVRITTDTPNGILAGMVVSAGTTNGTVKKCTGATDEPLGVAINNAVGYPYESMSGVGSGKCPYIHGSGTVFTTDLYEVYTSGSVAQTYAAGNKIYCGANGLLTKEDIGSSIQIGVVLIAPTTTDPYMAIQLVR